MCFLFLRICWQYLALTWCWGCMYASKQTPVLWPGALLAWFSLSIQPNSPLAKWEAASKQPAKTQAVPAHALAGHSRGCPDLAHARDPPDDLVADHELVLRPQFWLSFALGFRFWLSFALGFRLKPQVLHGETALVWKEVVWAVGWAAPSVLSCASCSLEPAAQLAWKLGSSSLPLNHSRGGRGFLANMRAKGKLFILGKVFQGEKWRMCWSWELSQ